MDAKAWDARYAAAERVWSAEPNRWVAEELAAATPGRALDLAAGEGRNALWLAGIGWAVTAVDFSAVAIAKGRSADPEHRVRWVQQDVLDPLPGPYGYDLVVVAYLQVVADTRRHVVHRAVEALAVGGELLVVGHDTSNLADGTGGPQHADVLFTPVDIVADLESSPSPAEIRRAKTVLRPVDGAPRPAIDALVRAIRR